MIESGLDQPSLDQSPAPYTHGVIPKWCGLKPLNFGVVCYTGKANYLTGRVDLMASAFFVVSQKDLRKKLQMDFLRDFFVFGQW